MIDLKGTLLNEPEFKYVKNSLLWASSFDNEWSFREKTLEYINDVTAADSNDFFFDMLEFVRFLQPGSDYIAYTTAEKLIYLNMPGEVGKNKFYWDFIYEHECLHQLWETFKVGEKIEQKYGNCDHELLNIASDCVINDFLKFYKKKKMWEHGITPESIEEDFGVKYDRTTDTQFTLYEKLIKLTKKDQEKLKDKYCDKGEQGPSGEGQQGGQQNQQNQQGGQGDQQNQQDQQGGQQNQQDQQNQQSGQKSGQQSDKQNQQGGQGNKQNQSGQKGGQQGDKQNQQGQQGNQSNGQSGDQQGNQSNGNQGDQNDDKLNKDQISQLANDYADRAQNMADICDSENSDNSKKSNEAAKNARKYADEAIDEANKGNIDKAKELLEKARQEANKAGDYANSVLSPTEEELKDITKRAKEKIDEYRNKLSGVFGDFLEQCNNSAKLRNESSLQVGTKVRSSVSWNKKLMSNINTYIKQKISKKRLEFEKTYKKYPRRKGAIQFGEPLQKGKRVKQDGILINVAFYIDKSSSMDYGNAIDNVFDATYTITEAIKNSFSKDKFVSDTTYKLFTFNTDFKEIPYGKRDRAYGGTAPLHKIADFIINNTNDYLINIILTDGEFDCDSSLMNKLIKNLSGIIIVVTNQKNRDILSLSNDPKFAHKLYYIEADSTFSVK